ncbi:hypothetical protein H0H81_009027 [Sphagnurus paluster]|uniref:Nucleoporin Nup54 alpha-helical domain-containing protein n=1 Tax=Sphagnurus paluster TaxID=117069 RepID=A0A9P7GIN2_9AGAR|nr:hypothetical protein H0H81_009027 [Sphagnurus paluster]
MSFFGNNPTTAPQTGGGLFGATATQQQQPAGGGLFGTPAQNTTQQTPSLFGSAQNTQPPSLFGNANTNTNTGGGLFGQAGNTPGTTGGGLFGQPQQQQQPAGGLFGNTQQQQQQGQANTGRTGLFGSTTQPPAPSGGLFGSNAQQQPATGGGLFGSTTQQQPAASGGLFGSTQQQPATGGGLFGSTTQQPATGGGLFGSTTTQQGGGLFGSTTTQPQQQQQSSAGSFGQPAAGGGLFGNKLTLNTNTTTPGTNPPSLFGNTLNQSQQQQPAATGGLFSQPSQSQARPSLFGQSTLNTNTNSLFGGGGSTFGSSTQAGFGASALSRTVGPAQQQADAQAQHAHLLQRIEGVHNAWNPASPQCRFKHTFYNLVNPNQISLYRQPPNVPNDVWEKATRENPDPKWRTNLQFETWLTFEIHNSMVPVIATGFDDIRERVDAQSRQAEQHKERLKDLKTRLDALSERHTLSNTARLQRAAVAQVQVTHRLLAFAQHLHLLIPAIRSSAIRPEEEALRGQLEEIEEDVRRGRIRGKLNELWALIGAVNAATERGSGGNGTSGEWAVVDEEGLAQIAQILSEQQNGLAHLTKILQKHQKDLAVIMGTSATNGEDQGTATAIDDSSWGSRSTLRASALR